VSLTDLYALSGSTKSGSIVSTNEQPEREKDVTLTQSNYPSGPSIHQQQLESQRYSSVLAPQPLHIEAALETLSEVLQASPFRSQRNGSELDQEKMKLMFNQHCGLALSQVSMPSLQPSPASKSPVSQHSPFQVRNDSLSSHQMPQVFDASENSFTTREDSLQHAEKDCPAIPPPVAADVDSDDELYAMPERSIAMLKQKSGSASLPRLRAAQQNEQSGTHAIKPVSSLPPISQSQQTSLDQRWSHQSGSASRTLLPQSHFPPSSQTADSRPQHASPLQSTKHFPQISDPQHPQIFQQFHPQQPDFPLVRTLSGPNLHAHHSEVLKPPGSSFSDERAKKTKRTSLLENLSGKFEGVGRNGTISEPPLNSTVNEPPSIVKRGSLLAKLGQKMSKDRSAKTLKKGLSDRFSRSASTSSVPNSLPSKNLSRLPKAGLIGGGSGGAQAIVHSGEPKNHHAQTGRFTSFDQALSEHPFGPDLDLPAWKISTQLAPSTPSEAPQQTAGLRLPPSPIQQQPPRIPTLQLTALQQPIHHILMPNLDGYQTPPGSKPVSVIGTHLPPSPPSHLLLASRPHLHSYPAQSDQYSASLLRDGHGCGLDETETQLFGGVAPSLGHLHQGHGPPRFHQLQLGPLLSTNPLYDRFPPTPSSLLPMNYNCRASPLSQQPLQAPQLLPLHLHGTTFSRQPIQLNGGGKDFSSAKSFGNLVTESAELHSFRSQFPAKQNPQPAVAETVVQIASSVSISGQLSPPLEKPVRSVYEKELPPPTIRPTGCHSEAGYMSVEPPVSHFPGTIFAVPAGAKLSESSTYGSSSSEVQLSIVNEGGSDSFLEVKDEGDILGLTKTDCAPSKSLSETAKNDNTPTTNIPITHSKSPAASGSVAQVLPIEVKLNEVEEKIAVRYEDGEKEVVGACGSHFEKEDEKFEEKGYTMSSTAYPGQWEPAYYGWS
jgi:hypothetical protein